MPPPCITSCNATAYKIPTDAPESDGTLQWDSTTMVVVQIAAGREVGMGYTYSGPSAVNLIESQLSPVVIGQNPHDIPRLFQHMVRTVRNLGRPGIASTAISAIDVALWDLKAKLLGVSLVALLGRSQDRAVVYGSGGFTSYSEERLATQAESWVRSGIQQVKMKVGREPDRDLHRVQTVRQAVGHAGLFVDANGAYARKQAIDLGRQFADLGVTWFEEPVSSDDLDGLRVVRDANIPALEIAAGEYGFHTTYFRRMLEAGAIDVLQVDATRCGGITGFLAAAAISEAYQIPVSAHCAPTVHMHLACIASNVRHIEYFHDHVRIEQMLFDGFVAQQHGTMTPSVDKPGLGLELKRQDAETYRLAIAVPAEAAFVAQP